MKINPQLTEYQKEIVKNDLIPNEWFEKFHVFRGLRDNNGKGVLTGLTNISDIYSKKIVNGKTVPAEGVLMYRGIPIEDIVSGFYGENRFGFEETVYLLMFGALPNREELANFNSLLSSYRTLPSSFTRDVIMKSPSPDIMNSLARSVLMLHSYDENANNIDIENVLAQSLFLIAVFPMLSVYSYHAYRHYFCDDSMIIHQPSPELSTAENILRLLRPDMNYTRTEARILDIALVLHAEHGGGNNSTFTTHVVTSTGTDTYSAIASALCSLKGPRHGGANIKTADMFENIKQNVKDWNDEGEIKQYLEKIMDKQAFDKAGLIYGVGHAIYAYSDPRAVILSALLHDLAAEKGCSEEYELFKRVEKLAPEVVASRTKVYKPLCLNIDFYSGYVYKLLNLPKELFTPIFAISRISGWCAHRLEELVNQGKIIRPAYENVCAHTEYIPLKGRK